MLGLIEYVPPSPSDDLQMISRTNNTTIAANTANPIHGDGIKDHAPLYLHIICCLSQRAVNLSEVSPRSLR
jgi:hypothetical protein